MQRKKKNKLDLNDCISIGNSDCVFSSLHGSNHRI